MEFNIEYLHNEVALKLDDLVVFGKSDVRSIIEKQIRLFEGVTCFPFQNSHMVYGYNKFDNPIKIGLEEGLIKRIILSTVPILQKRFKVVISYDGHNYSGFQIQKDQPTIQGELTRIISIVNDNNTLIQGASRTDAGVHGINYVFHFDSSKSLNETKWKEYLNYQLPDDILVTSVVEVHPLFHSRYDVYMKRYIYKISLGKKNPFAVNYEWFVKDLDLNVIKENLTQLVGTYDFSSFCKGIPSSSIRTIFHTELINNDDDEIILVFEGNGFLRYMIRIIVFALVEIAKGNLKMNISDIIKEKSRKHTKDLAPASGLYLENITY